MFFNNKKKLVLQQFSHTHLLFYHHVKKDTFNFLYFLYFNVLHLWAVKT